MGTFRRVATALAVALALTAVGAAPASADYSTTQRSQWAPNGTVYAMAVSPDGAVVYIGGGFTALRNTTTGVSVQRTRLAAFDAVTGALLPFAPTADATVRALAVSPDSQRIYAGGAFLNVNGQPKSRVVALTTSGAIDTAWNVTASNTVRDILLVGSDVYLAGLFGTVNGSTRAGLARVTQASGSVIAWKALTAGGKPWTLAVSPDGASLIVGGNFTTIGGVARSFVASVALDTAAVGPWAPAPLCDTCAVIDLTSDGPDVYAAVGGSGGRIARWDGATGALVWRTSGDGDCQAVAVKDGVVYAGGHFGPSFGGSTRHQLAALDQATGKLLPWSPTFAGNDHPGVWALSAGPDYLRVGGGFTSVNGLTTARYVEFAYVTP